MTVVDSDQDYQDDTARCGPCARGGGLLLLIVGAGLGWIGADLLTGGALTRLVTGGVAAGIAATSAAGTLIDDGDDPDDMADTDDTNDEGGNDD